MPSNPCTEQCVSCAGAQAGAFRGITFSQEDALSACVQDMLKKGYKLTIDADKKPVNKARLEPPNQPVCATDEPLTTAVVKDAHLEGIARAS